MPRLDQRSEVARAIRSVFDRPSRPAAEVRLKEIVTGYARGAPKLALWLEEKITVFTLPPPTRRGCAPPTRWSG